MVKLRESLSFVLNGLNVLRLKRDRLAEELNLLLKEMSQRKDVENTLMAIYDRFKMALATLGYAKVESEAYSMGVLELKINQRSIMNISIPEILVGKKPSANILEDPSLFALAETLDKLREELLHLASVEAAIERIAYELALVNRKVNAIEKAVVPSYTSQIKYIEDFLSDEELEEFTRVKHIKKAPRESSR